MTYDQIVFDGDFVIRNTEHVLRSRIRTKRPFVDQSWHCVVEPERAMKDLNFRNSECHRWLDANCEKEWQVSQLVSTSVYSFESIDDAVLFKLTWY